MLELLVILFTEKSKRVLRTKNGTIMLLSKCTVCNSKKPKCVKEQEASGLLSSLGIRSSLSRIIFLCPLLF